ncbi:hypothetical protein [Sphingobacterium prati]|uniref:hypothetical protein n=1 Tax=Sphingobacterium prati TaxID=2737006 RepID=UPI0015548140|nr:hypothetical protein [Sphingobacterium prati]NPE48933.1 hypothetical protein [Sphingobacterium prati]
MPKIISTLSASNGAETSYLLEYDAQGRITKVNEQQFHYGVNGRVDYSRIALQDKRNGIEREKIVRLSYHWDEQNRLKSVFGPGKEQSRNTARLGKENSCKNYLGR